MTLATIKGRLQTKVATFSILWAVTIGALFVTTNLMYGQMFLIAVAVGLFLEALWAVLWVHQPGWLTIALAGVEFAGIYGAAQTADLGISLGDSLTYYLSAWLLTQLCLIYLMPVWRLNWVDQGRELW